MYSIHHFILRIPFPRESPQLICKFNKIFQNINYIYELRINIEHVCNDAYKIRWSLRYDYDYKMFTTLCSMNKLLWPMNKGTTRVVSRREPSTVQTAELLPVYVIRYSRCVSLGIQIQAFPLWPHASAMIDDRSTGACIDSNTFTDTVWGGKRQCQRVRWMYRTLLRNSSSGLNRDQWLCVWWSLNEIELSIRFD